MISVTQEAKDHALKLISEEGRPDGTFIRVGVEGGGVPDFHINLHSITISKTETRALRIKE